MLNNLSISKAKTTCLSPTFCKEHIASMSAVIALVMPGSAINGTLLITCAKSAFIPPSVINITPFDTLG